MKRLIKQWVKRSGDEAIIQDLPSDVTVEILSKLPLKTLVRFKCVSKRWASLITDMSLSKPPTLLVILQSPWFDRYERRTPYFHSYTYALNDINTTTLISADKDSPGFIDGLDCQNTFRYVRGLVCCNCKSRPDRFAVFNPTTKQSLLLPKVGYDNRFMNGLFGYDPVENQYKVLCFIRHSLTNFDSRIFTFPSSKDQQWRYVGKSPDNFNPYRLPISSVCINGIIYYIGSKTEDEDECVIAMFDVRFERFDYIKELPVVLEKSLWDSTLVNYQGKLGCIVFDRHFEGESAYIWIMEDDTEQQEWSEIRLFIPSFLVEELLTATCGVTRSGDIVIMPLRLDNDGSYKVYAYYYDMKQKQTRRVELESTLQRDVFVYCEPNHFENTMSLTCKSKKKGAKRRFMKTLAFLKKQLLAIATGFSTRRVPV